MTPADRWCLVDWVCVHLRLLEIGTRWRAQSFFSTFMQMILNKKWLIQSHILQFNGQGNDLYEILHLLH
jgi:hypothetical protein